MPKNEMFFVSDKGSKVRVFGENLKAFEIDFDWFEEGVCVDAKADFNFDFDEPAIIARCNCCKDSPWKIKVKEVANE